MRFISNIFFLILTSGILTYPAAAELSENTRTHLRDMTYSHEILQDVHNALHEDDLTYRAYAVTYIGKYGTYKSVPLLIEALSDESIHVGANYKDSGMTTTRHRAALALRELTGENFGFQWDAPMEERQVAVHKWKDWMNERDVFMGMMKRYMSENNLQHYDFYRVHINAEKTEWLASLTENPPSVGAPALIVDRNTHDVRLIKGQ